MDPDRGSKGPHSKRKNNSDAKGAKTTEKSAADGADATVRRKFFVPRSHPAYPISTLKSDNVVNVDGEDLPVFNKEGIQLEKTSLNICVNGKRKRLDYAHLRDSCRCPKCVDPSTKQRNIQTSSIPLSIQPRSYGVQDGNLVLHWYNDIPGFGEDHSSVFSEQDLTILSKKPLVSATPDRYQIPWDRDMFERNTRRFDYNDYMNNDEEFARCMRDLSRFGLVILSNVPESREMVEKVATKMGPLRNSFYGETWDVRSVPQPKNVAYTDQFLNFHMDLLYMKDPPGYQLLHCLRNSCSGGESLFSDGIRCAQHLFYRDSAKFDALSSFEVNYGYNNMDQDYQQTRPTFELLPKSEYKNGHMGIEHINYSPPFQAPFRAPGPEWNQKYREYLEAVELFARLIEDPLHMYEFKLNPGDCVIFENRRVVHARRAFDTSSGERWLAGAYVDSDPLRSKFRILAKNHPELWREPLSNGADSDVPYADLPQQLQGLFKRFRPVKT